MRRYESVKIDILKPYENNARTHSEEQVKKIVRSIKEFGFINPVLIDGDFGIIAGHGRVMAAKKMGMTEVPCLFVEDLTEAQKRAYIIADNKLALDAGWDEEMLQFELAELQEMDFDITLTGFELEDLEDDEPHEVVEDDYEVAPPEEPKTKMGDIWQLGRHRLMCGDSTDKATIAKLMDGNKADMVFTDPPYGMKKEAEGVLNDNLNFNDLLDFNKLWIPLTFEILKDNGSWYCWGIDEPLMDIYSHILKPMAKDNKITFRNLITWDKGHGQGQLSADFRMYPTADEKCLFAMCGVQGFDNNKDNYFDGFEPIRLYLCEQKKIMGWNDDDIQRITGVTTVARHCFCKSQWEFPTEEHYNEMREAANGNAFNREYDEIKREYDEIKREYYATRAYFDNTHDNMNNVWHFARTSGSERELTGGHATPKPIALCSRAIKSSSRDGESVLDVFGGSGSTLIACEQLDRTCYMMELDEKYCDVIINRWEQFTGEKAVLLNG